jgi:hypothetical protein
LENSSICRQQPVVTGSMFKEDNNIIDVTCKVCGKPSEFVFTAKVLNKYEVKYYRCGNCEFIQTEKPYWLTEAYNNPINLVDTGLTRRNILASKSVAVIIFLLFNKKAKFLDYAGGYGMFTRLMRDIGFDFYTYDPYTPNLLAKGFDYNKKDTIELLTTFESFEHFEEPLAEIEKMLAISRNIFFSTQLVPHPVPAINEWWYYAPEHGQHIAFYTHKTLQFIAAKYGLVVYTLKGYHLLTGRKIPGLYFKLLVAAGRFGLSKAVQLFMKTKVMDDMEALSTKNING